MLKQCLNAFQTLAPARLATPAAGPFLPQNGRKNFASPHCASLQNFAFILVQASLKIALSCPFPPFPAFLHSSIPPRPPFITLHENSQPPFLCTSFSQMSPFQCPILFCRSPCQYTHHSTTTNSCQYTLAGFIFAVP